MDSIGAIAPPSSKGHSHIIVVTDYFTKWVEAKSFNTITTEKVIAFVEEYIFTRFGIPETITIDQATVFKSPIFDDYLTKFGVKKIHSTPYYAQANGQAESTNKIISNGISKMVDANPREWHELLIYALWAYRTSKREATRVTPFQLVYGHDPVISAEINIRSSRVAKQMEMTSAEYREAMNLELMESEAKRIESYERMKKQKEKIAKVNNKKVKMKTFETGDLVWKMFLPESKYKDHFYGK